MGFLIIRRRLRNMTTNNFIQFNSKKNNMMSDADYPSKASQGLIGGGVRQLIVAYIINSSIKWLLSSKHLQI